MRGILGACLTMILYVVGQALLFHGIAIRRKLSVMVALWVGGLGLYGALYRVLPDDAAWLPGLLAADSDVVNLANGMFLYWCLFAGYYQFVNMADNSFGVRSLIELAGQASGGLTLDDFARRNPYGAMVDRRLARSVAAGFLVRGDDGRYHCRPKARCAAAVFGWLKRLLALGPGG